MKPSNKGIYIMKDIDRFHEAEEINNKGIDSTSYANKGSVHGASSVGASLVGKKFVTKIKVLKKLHVQSNESDSEVDEDYVTFLDSGGW